MSRVALVTGASRGLGRQIAEGLHMNGYGLVLGSMHRKITGAVPPNACFVYGDLSNQTVLDTLASEGRRQNISVLVNNAGVYLNDANIGKAEEREWRRVVEINLLAPMALTLRLWSVLRKNKGVVVNINSLAGKSAGRGEIAYSASKHGLRGFSSALQFEGTRDDVRVFEVYVGAMNTEMTVGRADRDKFISPGDAASLICDLIEKQYTSLRMTEIELARRIY